MSDDPQTSALERAQREPGLKIGSFLLTPTGVILLDDHPSYEEWELVCVQVQAWKLMIHWWIGDLLRIGRERFGEGFAQALPLLPYADRTLETDEWVASAVDVSRRREPSVLSWSHHREVAPLLPERQSHWLGVAERENLTTKELRAAIREERSGPARESLLLFQLSLTQEEVHLLRRLLEKKKDPVAARLRAKLDDLKTV